MKRSTLHGWLLWVLAVALTAVSACGENESTIQRLRLVKFVPPEIPEALRLEGMPAGVVTLAVSHDSQGVPGDILVLDTTHPRLVEPALAAVRQWRFPAEPEETIRQEAPVVLRLGFSVTGIVLRYDSMEHELAKQKLDRLDERITVKAVADLSVKPRALRQAMPEYPADATPAEPTGQARVAFYIDADGKVRLPYLVSASDARFGDAALDAVRQWQYEPSRDRNQPTVVAENWVFHYNRREQ